MKNIKRIAVKVGSSTLTHENGKINIKNVDHLSKVLSDVLNMGIEVVLVSSGAIAAGFSRLGLSEKPKELRIKQASAAVGQGALLYMYEKFFSEYGHSVAQILLNKKDVENEHRSENLTNTFNTLLEYGIVPIVNENDSVAVDEILIGDNDNLSATVATLIKADLLILFTDIDGLYDSDPHKNANAKLISEVRDIDSVMHLAGDATSNRGTGGMVTKLEAAKHCMDNGINMVIANGSDPDVIYSILKGERIGTLFIADRE